MLRFLIASPLALGSPAARAVTDGAGRSVAAPDEARSAFAAGPLASVLLYLMKPETLTGLARALRPEDEAYVAEPFRGLPETARLTGRGGAANLERALEMAPTSSSILVRSTAPRPTSRIACRSRQGFPTS